MPTREKHRLTWRKSSYSNANNGDCVEVAHPWDAAAVRDSKDRARGSISAPANSWEAFLTTLRG